MKSSFDISLTQQLIIDLCNYKSVISHWALNADMVMTLRDKRPSNNSLNNFISFNLTTNPPTPTTKVWVACISLSVLSPLTWFACVPCLLFILLSCCPYVITRVCKQCQHGEKKLTLCVCVCSRILQCCTTDRYWKLFSAKGTDLYMTESTVAPLHNTRKWKQIPQWFFFHSFFSMSPSSFYVT